MKTKTELYYSDCCGAQSKSNGDTDTQELGYCPECKEHCTYLSESELDKEMNDEEQAAELREEQRQERDEERESYTRN